MLHLGTSSHASSSSSSSSSKPVILALQWPINLLDQGLPKYGTPIQEAHKMEEFFKLAALLHAVPYSLLGKTRLFGHRFHMGAFSMVASYPIIILPHTSLLAPPVPLDVLADGSIGSGVRRLKRS
ncbi:hypothetical protein AMTRI_Chr11g153510 [Amborella trichopoda]